MLTFIALTLAFTIGFIAQKIGLCMVKGVRLWFEGDKSFLLAILLSSTLSWVSVFIAYQFQLPLSFNTYQANLSFFVGGLLFGLGAAFNVACGISTFNKLSQGQGRMLFTIIGWIIGWILLSHIHVQADLMAKMLPDYLFYSGFAVVSLILMIWMR